MRIFVVLYGGLVADVYTEEPVEVTVIDYDTEGEGPKDDGIHRLDNGDLVHVSSGPTLPIEELYKELRQLR